MSVSVCFIDIFESLAFHGSVVNVESCWLVSSVSGTPAGLLSFQGLLKNSVS